ncbi:MAG: GNAT family N-acetyltransferase [Planctomycetota bacterium]
MIEYHDSAENFTAEQLVGFFVGWPNPPSQDTHLEILRRSFSVCVATDTETGRVVGFGTAVSDGVLAAYLPLLEVLPEFQQRGIGTTVAQRLLNRLRDLYMVDLVCDPKLAPFYERLGMRAGSAMTLRRYDRQAADNDALR